MQHAWTCLRTLFFLFYDRLAQDQLASLHTVWFDPCALWRKRKFVETILVNTLLLTCCQCRYRVLVLCPLPRTVYTEKKSHPHLFQSRDITTPAESELTTEKAVETMEPFCTEWRQSRTEKTRAEGSNCHKEPVCPLVLTSHCEITVYPFTDHLTVIAQLSGCTVMSSIHCTISWSQHPWQIWNLLHFLTSLFSFFGRSTEIHFSQCERLAVALVVNRVLLASFLH